MQHQGPCIFGIAVKYVADNRPAHRFAMHAQLMRAAGLGGQFQPGHALILSHDFIVRHGALAGWVHLHVPTVLLGRDFCQRQIDTSVLVGGNAVDDRPILFVNAFLLEHLTQDPQGLLGAAQDQTAAGIAVQSVRQVRRLFCVELKIGKMIFQIRPAARTCMHRQTCRFVDNQDICVFIEEGGF